MKCDCGASPLRRLAWGLAACVLGACGSHAGGLLPNDSPALGRVPLTAAESSRSRIKAVFRIVVPRHKARARFVSPATQSIAISVTPSGGGTAQSFNADLTPASNPNCTGSPTVCTLTMALGPGTYNAVFATYDGLLAGGNAASNPPTGTELSANQNVPLSIVPGTNNAIDLTLGGLPASVRIVPTGSTLGGSMNSGFTVSKCFPTAQVQVTGYDADGNAILGPGAPLPALVSGDTAHLAVAAPAPSSPNTFTLSRPSIPNANSIVQLTASVSPVAGSGGKTPSVKASLTFNGDVCGTITEYPIPTASSLPQGIAVGSDGALWFTENLGNKIGRITTDGTIAETTVPSAAYPRSITAGSDGALWFTQDDASDIGRITTGASINQYPIPVGASGLVAGPDGAIWFTENSDDKIGQLTIGAVNRFTIPTDNSAPVKISPGPDGALWFTEFCGNQIGRVTTGGGFSEYPVPTKTAHLYGITAGPDGALWFTECAGNNIGRITTGGAIVEYPLPTKFSGPRVITPGPDGALWFAEGGKNVIGRITTAGTITETPIPTNESSPVTIVTGPDGALWFTENGANKIGRLQ